MRVFNKIGSKERLYEVFQNINKLKLNENIEDINLLELCFEKLNTNQLDIEEINTQVDNDMSYASVKCLDLNKNQIEFNFKAKINETDQDDVFNLEDINLVKFIFKDSKDLNNNVELDENDLVDFNNKHKGELENISDKYIDVDSKLDNELSEEIEKKTDSYPYGGGSTRLQTGKQYADEKPTNPKLRIHNDELNKFIDENFNEKISQLNRNVNFLKLSDTYKSLMKMGKEIKGMPEYQNTLSSLSNVITNYLNNNDIEVSNDEIQNYFNKQYSFIEENTENDNKYDIKKGDSYTDILYGGFYVVNNVDIPNNKVMLIDINDGQKYYVYYDKMLQYSGDRINREDDNFQFLRTARNTEIDWDSIELGNKREKRIKDIMSNKDASYNLTGKYYPSVYDFKDISNQKLGLNEDINIEQITKEKEKNGDIIPGGLGDNDSISQYDPEQIAKGIKVEMEHTDNPMIALDIVLDHLHEKSNYYTSTDNPEDSAQINAAEEAIDDKIDTEDILLGYRPKNIGENFN